MLEQLVLESKNQFLTQNEFVPHAVFDFRSLDGLAPNVGRDQKSLHLQPGSIHRCRDPCRAAANDDQVVPMWLGRTIFSPWDFQLHYRPVPFRRENIPPLLLPPSLPIIWFMNVLAVSRRRRSKKSYSSFMVFLILLVTGCAGSPIFSRPVYQDPILIVRLDSPLYKARGHAATNSHPIVFTVQDLQAILQAMKIQKEVSFLNYYVFRHDATPKAVFPSEVAGLLAPHISAALSKAQPEEIVVFVMSRSRKDGIPLITSGGLFVRGDQLMVVLAHVETPMTSERKREQVQANPLTPVNNPDFHFVVGPSQTILTPTDASELRPGSSSAPTVSIHYKALLAHSPDQVLPLKPDSDSLPLSSSATVEEKLRQLRSWHQQGLISEQEYREKRAEILASFQ